MPFEEASYRLNSAPDSDIERHFEARAMSERIREWLATPEGTVAHDPSWGHNLLPFKHDPMATQGTTLEVLITMALARKMPLDIEDLRLVAVQVEVLDIDLCRVSVVHQYGKDVAEISL